MAEPRLRDDAGFFSPDAIAKANEGVAKIKRDFGKDVYVRTVASIPEDRKSQYQPERRAEFFAKWADEEARAEKVDGLIVFVCRDPSYLEVRVGKNTIRQAFIQQNATELRSVLLDKFKAKQFDEGLLAGVQYVEQTFAQSVPKRSSDGSTSSAPPMALPAPRQGDSPAPSQVPSRQTSPAPRSTAPSMGSWLCIGIAAVLVIGLLMRALSASRRMQGGGGYGAPGAPGYGQPGYGGYNQPGYGGGGGLGRGMLGGLLGGLLGGYAYDRWSHGSSQHNNPSSTNDPSGGVFGGGAGGSFGDSSDFGSGGGGGAGGDFGGGDSGGGGFSDSGGGGGGDSGGGGGAGGDF